MKGNRVLVTGANGFLGKHLCKRLLAENVNVVAHGRNKKSVEPFFIKDRVEVLACDLEQVEATKLIKDAGPFNAIIHCAGLSSNWGKKAAFQSANIEATKNILMACDHEQTPHFIYVSSSSVYFDFCDQLLVKENQTLPIPANNYAWSKSATEDVVRSTKKLPTTIIRPRGIYGNGDKALLPRLIRAASRGPIPLFRGGNTVIDLTHVEDVVSALIAILNAPEKTNGKTYNVSGGEGIAVRHIIEQTAKRSGIEVRWRPTPWPLAHVALSGIELFHKTFRPNVEPIATLYSAGLLAFNQTLCNLAIQDDIGWKTKISFAEGLEKTFQKAS